MENPRPLPQPRVIRRPKTRRRFHYFHRHTPHFYLVLAGISGAIVSFLMSLLAFDRRSIELSNIAFGVVAATSLVIFCAFFWGFYMLASGNIPTHRLRVFVPHAMVGVLAPLFYTINICLDLENVGIAPISEGAVICSGLCIVMLGIQFTMGKRVVRREPLHIVRNHDATSV